MTLSHEPTLPTSVAPQVLLGNHLKALKLPTFAREYEKVAMESAQDRADYPRYLLRLCELERIDREQRNVERRIRIARFPQTKSLDTFDFAAQPSLNKSLVLELARSDWIEKRHNSIALGPSGTGKTHVALALGLAACQKGYSVAFTTAAALVHELMEARDERRLRALQKHLNTVKLLIVDELGYVPFTAVGSELLFEVFSQRYERGSMLVTSNLPFDEWTTAFGSERLDLPPSEWSIDYFSVDPEGERKWARDTGLRRLSASCVKQRSCWRRAERRGMRVVGSRSLSRRIIAGARNMAV